MTIKTYSSVRDAKSGTIAVLQNSWQLGKMDLCLDIVLDFSNVMTGKMINLYGYICKKGV